MCQFQRSCSCLIAFWGYMCIPACFLGFFPHLLNSVTSLLCSPLIIAGFSAVSSYKEHKTVCVPLTILHKISLPHACRLHHSPTLMEDRRCQKRQEEVTLKVITRVDVSLGSGYGYKRRKREIYFFLCDFHSLHLGSTGFICLL